MPHTLAILLQLWYLEQLRGAETSATRPSGAWRKGRVTNLATSGAQRASAEADLATTRHRQSCQLCPWLRPRWRICPTTRRRSAIGRFPPGDAPREAEARGHLSVKQLNGDLFTQWNRPQNDVAPGGSLNL